MQPSGERRDWKDDERMEMSVALDLMRARTYMSLKETITTLVPHLVSSMSRPRHLGQRWRKICEHVCMA